MSSFSLEEIEKRLRLIQIESLQNAAKQFIPIFFDMTTDLMCAIEPGGTWALLSNSWAVVLGWDIQAKYGKPFLDSVHPDDRKSTGSAFRRYNFEDEEMNGKYFNRYLRADGTYVWLSWEEAPGDVYESTGYILGVARVVEDENMIKVLEANDFTDIGNGS